MPQTANWDLVGGVNFQKGCYPGQEIVARMQYLGRLKERLHLFHVDGAAAAAGHAGSTAPPSATRPAAPSSTRRRRPDGGSDLLAVVQLSALDGPLHLGTPDGPLLAPRALPYRSRRRRAESSEAVTALVVASPMHVHYYVWYRDRRRPRGRARGGRRDDGATSLVRRGITGRAARAPRRPATWMEIYEDVADVPRFERELADGARAPRRRRAASTDGARHVEPSSRPSDAQRHVPRRRRARRASAIRAGGRRQSRRVPRARRRARARGATQPPFRGHPRRPRPAWPAARGSACGATGAGRWSPTCAKAGANDPAAPLARRTRAGAPQRDVAPATALAALACATRQRYNGFNLLAGDAAQRDAGCPIARRRRARSRTACTACRTRCSTRRGRSSTRTHGRAARRGPRAATPTLSPLFAALADRDAGAGRRAARHRRPARLGAPAVGAVHRQRRLRHALLDGVHDRPRGPRALPSSARSMRDGDASRRSRFEFDVARVAPDQRATALRVHRPVRNARLHDTPRPSATKPMRA